MLRLDKIEISGFKSFVDKAELTFPGNVTAIVGPNGCGKSNICDAVAWVLGEQSAKILRGEKMDDLIFNGSGRRRPIGMAEVTLHLRTDDGADGRGEVSIGRRVYRDGDAEYLLNGAHVRLKDVQDVLFGTGLGVRTYSIIEQGMIEQVLSTKPQDRRRLIEEAAGITKYKVRRRSAELKLEETRANLTRLADIIAEVERACNSLKRQASKAERYRERSAEWKARRMTLVRFTFDDLVRSLARAQEDLSARRNEEAAGAAALAGKEAAEAESRRAAIEIRRERDLARERLAEISTAVERDDAAIEAARRSEAEIAARLEALARNSEELSREAAHDAEERQRLEALLGARRLEHETAEASRTAAAGARSSAEQRLSGLEQAADRVRLTLVQIAADRAAGRNARHEIDLGLERIAAARARLQAERERLTRESEGVTLELAALSEEEAAHARASEDAALESESARERLAVIESSLAARESARARLREEAAALDQKVASLDAVRAAQEKDAGAIVECLAASGFSSRGVVASILTPIPGWEEALDRLLGDELAAVVADASLEQLAADLGNGRIAGSVVARSDAGSAAPGWDVAVQNVTGLPAEIRAALPDVTFVESREDAFAGARREPGRTFVARSGDVIRGSFWKMHSRSSRAGLLSLRHDLAAARERLTRLPAELSALESEIASLRAARDEQDALARSVAERRAATDAGRQAVAARRGEREGDLARRRRDLETLAIEEEMRRSEGGELSATRADALAREASLERAEEDARRALEALLADCVSARLSATAASEDDAQAREVLEGARERLAAAEREWIALESRTEVISRRRQEWGTESRILDERRATAGREAEEARRRRDTNVLGRDGAAREFERLALETDTLGICASEAEEAVRAERARFEEIRQRRFDAEIGFSRLESDLTHAREDARREFGCEADALEPVPELTPEERAALEAQTVELADQIERMGPVNVLAADEYKEQSDRFNFLSAQRQDLDAAIASLLDTIRKINATSTERFTDAFEKINRNFSELFQRLFRGGSAAMRLLDENDPLDSGIEIVAQPPGKRNQSILLLSGGEKAMSAIALLMAIFRYKPSPFCILDEVDAPLDEANIDSFTRLIREMSEDTQFLTITHNKRTMESADTLYGVTMEEPGCSSLVSVRFD